MENAAPTANAARKDHSIDPVKAQGILKSLTKKEQTAVKLWPKRWGFYSRLPEIQKQEALNLGMTEEEYKFAVESLNCQPDPKQYPVTIQPSPTPLPCTSSGMIGRRATCSLEIFGRLVKTERDYPIHPPLPPGQVYDPYKQNFIFLDMDCGDPISYKLPPSTCEVPPDFLSRPLYPEVMPLNAELLEKALLTPK